jgi:hypothetical protein
MSYVVASGLRSASRSDVSDASPPGLRTEVTASAVVEARPTLVSRYPERVSDGPLARTAKGGNETPAASRNRATTSTRAERCPDGGPPSPAVRLRATRAVSCRTRSWRSRNVSQSTTVTVSGRYARARSGNAPRLPAPGSLREESRMRSCSTAPRIAWPLETVNRRGKLRSPCPRNTLPDD